MAQKIFDTDLRIGGPAGPLIISGAGTPESVVTAPVGSQFHRTDGGTGTTIYRKESGTGNTGWVATAAGGGGGGSPGGAASEVQFNDGAGGFAGASSILIEGDETRFPAIPTPAAPAADGIKVYNKRKIGQRDGLAMLFSSGREAAFQEDLGDFQTFCFRPASNSAGVLGDGSLPQSVTGTATAGVTQETNIFTMWPRVEARVTVAAATAVAGFRGAGAFVRVGRNANAPGGFFSRQIWGPSTGVIATHRGMCGLINSTAAPTDVEPSTLINGVWMGWDAADANIQIMHNDGSGVATKIDLGASFPVPITASDTVYMLELYSPDELTQSVQYRVTRFTLSQRTPAAEATGTITTNLPLVTTLLSPRMYCSVGGVSSVVGIAQFGTLIATDY